VISFIRQLFICVWCQWWPRWNFRVLSTASITLPSFDETARICAIPTVVDTRRVLRARETTARGVYPKGWTFYLLSVKFLYACTKLHCGMGKWRHVPNCNDSCDWSSHLWLRAGNPHPCAELSPHAVLTYDSIANHANSRCQKHDSFPRVEWCKKCVIFRYPIREAVTKYDSDVITATEPSHTSFPHDWMAYTRHSQSSTGTFEDEAECARSPDPRELSQFWICL
jgi:hypothetical protein